MSSIPEHLKANPVPAQSPAPCKTEYVPISEDMKTVFIDGFGCLPIQYPSNHEPEQSFLDGLNGHLKSQGGMIDPKAYGAIPDEGLHPIHIAYGVQDSGVVE